MPRSTSYRRVTSLTRDIDIAILSVSPSVRLSVRDTLVLYQKRLNTVVLSSRHESPFILVLCIRDLREIPTGSPPAGLLNRGGRV